MVVVVDGSKCPSRETVTPFTRQRTTVAMPPGREYSSTALEIFEAGDELAREGEPDALKGACPVREGLH